MPCRVCAKYLIHKGEDGGLEVRKNPITGDPVPRARPPLCHDTCGCKTPDDKPTLTDENAVVFKAWLMRAYLSDAEIPLFVLEAFAILDRVQKADDLLMQAKLLYPQIAKRQMGMG